MEYAASESQEQQMLMKWIDFAMSKYPALGLIYHIPNERKCSNWQGGKLKREGVRAGVPDLCLPVANKNHNALYIEMKRKKGNKPTANQLLWLNKLNEYGNLAVVCYGSDQAITVIEKYLKNEI